MAAFRIHLVGQHQSLDVDLPFADLDDLLIEASRAKFLAGHMVEPDGDGVCRRVMIATGRIQCVIEAGYPYP
jgi:hypothetical protein